MCRDQTPPLCFPECEKGTRGQEWQHSQGGGAVLARLLPDTTVGWGIWQQAARKQSGHHCCLPGR